MPNPKFNTTDKVIIALFFVLYMIGYAWLIEPKQETVKKIEKNTVIQQPERLQTEKR